MTRPGVSARRRVEDQKIVWKCFVLPGVLEARTLEAPTRALRREDLPTFGWL
jgi:hypothetical protein